MYGKLPRHNKPVITKHFASALHLALSLHRGATVAYESHVFEALHECLAGEFQNK